MTSIGVVSLIYPMVDKAGSLGPVIMYNVLYQCLAVVSAPEGMFFPAVMFVTTFAGWYVVRVIDRES